jgi:hypothetical protein
VANTDSKVIYSNDWKEVTHSKRPTNSTTVPPQNFKIPTVVNRYTVLENLQEVNQASHQQYRNQVSPAF